MIATLMISMSSRQSEVIIIVRLSRVLINDCAYYFMIIYQY